MKTNTTLTILLALATLSGGCFSSCLTGDDGSEGNVFHLPLTSDIRALDPAVAYDQASWEVIPNLYEPLFQFSYLQDPYRLEPLLAADQPDISDDRKTVTIQIQRGVHFHPDSAFGDAEKKGRELVAADFVYSIKRLALPQLHSPGWALIEGRIEGLDEFRSNSLTVKSPHDALKAKVVGLSAPERYTLKLKLTRPFPRLLQVLALPFTSVVSREVVESKSDSNGILRDHAIGTGPYILSKRMPGRETILTRNPDYHPSFYPIDSHPRFVKAGLTADAGKTLPFIGSLTFEVVSDEPDLWNRFISGTLDTYSPPPERLSQILDGNLRLKEEFQKLGIRSEIESAASTFVLIFNTEDEVLGKNKLIRQAISAAVPRDDFIAQFTSGSGIKALTSVPPGVPGRPAQPLIKYDYDLALSKQLLEEAGYPEGQGLPLLRLDMRGAGVDDRRMGEFFRDAMTRAGIKLQVVYNSFPGYLDKLQTGKFQISVSRWSLDYPDAENVFQMIYGPNKKNGLNLSRIDHAQLNSFYESLTQAEPGIDRSALVNKIEEVLQEELPWIPLYHSTQVKLYQAWVGNFRGNEMILNRYKYYRMDREVRDRYLKLKE